MSEEVKNAKVNPADSNAITRDYIDHILIEERLIDAREASIKMELFGRQFDTPIMMPAFSHLDEWIRNGRNSMVEYAVAARSLNAVNFVGMRENEKMDEIFDTGAATIRIVKPYADKEKIFSQIAYAKNHGAFAVGMDIDHIFGNDGKYDVVLGELMDHVTMEELKRYIEAAAPLPFVVKGVLSVSDAKKAVEAGAAAILVSHHGGRLPYAVPTLKMLPKIREAVGDQVKIWVDCCLNSGADAFKALALGADAVAVGKAMMPALTKDGHEGVEAYWEKMNQELATLMNYTGCATIEEITPDLLWLP